MSTPETAKPMIRWEHTSLFSAEAIVNCKLAGKVKRLPNGYWYAMVHGTIKGNSGWHTLSELLDDEDEARTLVEQWLMNNE